MSTNGTTNDELWSVALPNGQIQKGTLDQLDDAFNAGLLTSDSLVLAPGATEWAKLGELAGLEAPAPPTQPSYAAPVAPSTLRPVAIELDESMLDPSRMRPSKKPLVFGAIGAIAAVAAVLVFAVSGTGGPDKPAAGAAAAATATATQTATVAPKPPAPPPEVSAKPLLSEDQKKALLDADEARSRLLKGKRAAQDANKPYVRSQGISDSAGFGGPKGKGSGKCTCKAGDPLCSCM